jgi:hypothetical protein
MNELLKGLLLWLFLVVLIYLSFSFVNLDINFINWDKNSRVFCIISIMFFLPLMLLFAHSKLEEL